MKPLYTPLIACMLLTVAGCTWVSQNPQIKQQGIMVLPLDRVAHCRLLSKTQVSIADSIGPVKRVQSDVERDLQNLAMNQAVIQGGDTVSALDAMNNGNQTFGIYKCLGAPAVAPATPPAAASSSVRTTPYVAPGAGSNSPAGRAHAR
ncbi:MAG: hypothetical protein ACRESA_06645 [Gammaproteobacteria bacterium]